MSQLSEVKQAERDRYVLGMLPLKKGDAVTLVDLVANGWRFGTVRASLNRLLAAKAVECVWDGNERYGRYLYYAV